MSAFTFDESADTREAAVFQALGAASTCWERPEAAGVFDSDRAKEIGEALLEVLDQLPAEAEVRSISATVSTLRRAADLLDVIPAGFRRRNLLLSSFYVSPDTLREEAAHLERLVGMLEEVRP